MRPVWLFNILLALLVVTSPVRGIAQEREEVEQQEPEKPERVEQLDKKALHTARTTAPHRPQQHHVVTFAGTVRLHDTVNRRVLPPRQLNERRLI